MSSELSLKTGEVANVLDITDLKEHGDELKKAILNAVKDTQSVIITTLPNVILMSQDQFNELDPSLDKMYQSNQRLYITPLNAMEVTVKEL